MSGEGETESKCAKGRLYTKADTLWESGAPEHHDLRLLEDGSERGGAPGSEGVARETARDGLGHSERAGA